MTSDDPRNGALFDLSARAKFRVTGADRVRFLNGQLTNDVRKAVAERAVEACALNAKGRITAHLFLSADADAFFLDVDRELREALPARLERYLIADDVQIEDVTDQFAILHCIGPDTAVVTDALRSIESDRFGFVGRDIWFDGAQRDRPWQDLAARLPAYDADRAETLRIESGIPRWGAELSDEIIPQEANLEARCIDYEKGCYIGQEVISRMKMSGQTNKRLCGLISDTGSALPAGTQLIASPDEPKIVGHITSATFSHRCGGQVAMGYVKRGHNASETVLSTGAAGNGGSPLRIRIVDLPFIPQPSRGTA